MSRNPTPGTAALVFADRPIRRRRERPWGPPPLRGLPVVRVDKPADAAEVDTAIAQFRRLVVVGDDADLAAVLTRLLRTDRLDVEVGYSPRRRTAATRIYRLPAGWRAARRARHGRAGRIPLIRDDAGTAIAGAAGWLPTGDRVSVHGEAVVDDTVLFDGDVAGVRIEPTVALPGLRARVRTGAPGRRGRPRRWVAGRAAQLGTTGAAVVRDGVTAPGVVRRSTFYRHVEGWLLVR